MDDKQNEKIQSFFEGPLTKKSCHHMPNPKPKVRYSTKLKNTKINSAPFRYAPFRYDFYLNMEA